MSKMTVPEIKKHLANHNIRASLPRVKIYDYLVTYESHPTVDEIYNALVDELVTLSKTTVYNTMDLFAENNVVIELLIEKNEIRYDADIMHRIASAVFNGMYVTPGARQLNDGDQNYS